MFRLKIEGSFFLILDDSNLTEISRHQSKDVEYQKYDELSVDPTIEFSGVEKPFNSKSGEDTTYKTSELLDENGVAFPSLNDLYTFLNENLGKSSGGSTSGTTEIKGWLYPYIEGEWEKGTMTRVGDWCSISNTTTSDFPTPIAVGEDISIYDGVLTNQSALAKQVVIGQRYTSNNPFYLKAYSINTVIGNNYDVYSVVDPLGSMIVNNLSSFTATQSGDIVFNVSPSLIDSGVSFDLVVIIREPNPTPTTTLANYNYTKPNNPETPLIGGVVHSSKTIDVLSISKTDNDTIDRTSLLDSLSLGDVITLGNLSWSIQSKIDQGTYYDISVSPQLQASEVGVVEFAFETVVATPISYGDDVDYFLNTPNIEGFISVDGTYNDITLNNNAYSLNLVVQDVSFSDDWDIVASVGGGQLINEGVYTSSFDDGVIERLVNGVSTATDQQPTGLGEAGAIQIEFGVAQNTASDPVQLLADGSLVFNESGMYRLKISLIFGRLGGAGEGELRFRALVNGVQVGQSIGAEIDSQRIEIPYSDEAWLNVPAGTVVTYEVMRDSSGNNSGGLFQPVVTSATAPTWNDTTCAAIRVERFV